MDLELYRLRWFIQDHKNLVIAFIAICLIGFILGMGVAVHDITPVATPEPTVDPGWIVNASTTPIINGSGIVNASTVTPTPNATAHPESDQLSFDEYIRAIEGFYGKSEPPWTEKTFIDPLSPEGYALYMNWTKTARPSIKPFDGTEFGVSIYGSPTPTPTPTPPPDDPFTRETHTRILDAGLADLQINAQTNGYLSLKNTRGLYNYYHPGDYAVIQADFINTNPDPVVNPIAKIEFNKVDKFGHIIPWIYSEKTYNYTIDAAKWDYDRKNLLQATSFKYVEEIGIIPNVIPENGVLLDSKGSYQMKITIYNADKSLALCIVSWQVNII